MGDNWLKMTVHASRMATFLIITLGAAAYFSMVFLSGAFDRDQLLRLIRRRHNPAQ